MTFMEMADEYQTTKILLKDKIHLLKKKQPESEIEARELRTKINMLYSMYLDCQSVEIELRRKAKKWEKKHAQRAEN